MSEKATFPLLDWGWGLTIVTTRYISLNSFFINMSQYWNNLSKRFTKEATVRAQQSRRPVAIPSVERLTEEIVWLSSTVTLRDNRAPKNIPSVATTAFVDWWTSEQEKLHQLKILRRRLAGMRKLFHKYEVLVRTEEQAEAVRYLQWCRVEKESWSKGVSDPQPQFLSPIAPHNARQYFRTRQCPSKFKWIQLAWSQPADYLMSVNYAALDNELVEQTVLDPRNFSTEFVKWFFRGALAKEEDGRMEQRIAMIEPIKELVRAARLFTDHEGRRDHRALVLKSTDPYFDGQILVLSERQYRDQAPQAVVSRFQDLYSYQRSLSHIEDSQQVARELTSDIHDSISQLVQNWLGAQAGEDAWANKRQATGQVVEALSGCHAAPLHRASQLLTESTNPYDRLGRKNPPAKQTKVWAAGHAVQKRQDDIDRQGGHLAEKATAVDETINYYEQKWRCWENVWKKGGLMEYMPRWREDLSELAAAWWAFEEHEGFPLAEPFAHIFREGLVWRHQWENLLRQSSVPTANWVHLQQRVAVWVETVNEELTALKKEEPPQNNSAKSIENR